MIFSRVVAALFAFGTISAVASPAPAVVEKREDVSDVLAVISTLQSTTGGILPQIDSLVNTDTATEENLTPLLQQLTAAFDTSAVSLEALQGRVDENTGGTKDEVAEQTAAVYTDVIRSLDNLKTKTPQFWPLVPQFGLDAALTQVLLGLNILLAGVVQLVAAL
ncbi:hypothetical protein EST38_g10890 [Candolleomyces aberdarensis]|uniref:Cell wall protein n=1 Tax=Candolleomyces aberdarensis TaxID=2316362 RepID=A0A4Q2D6A4_9AGAR|nr:hypothetical protein EST38_g10890 [Candolleomyces aberdarensis]